MRKLLLIVVSCIAATITVLCMGAGQDDYSKWLHGYESLFNRNMGAREDVKWVYERIRIYYPDEESLHHSSARRCYGDRLQGRFEWADSITIDTCYNWLSPHYKSIQGYTMVEMLSYSTLRRDTTSFFVGDLAGVIWSFRNNWPQLMADFSLQKGDIFHPECILYSSFESKGWGNGNLDMEILEVDSIEVRDRRYRRLTVGLPDDDKVYNIWVQGIGWQNGDFPGGFYGTLMGLDYERFVAKYENDVLIFTYDDFEAPAIGSSSVGPKTIDFYDRYFGDDRIFNLQGREINRPNPGEMYIQHGKVKMEPKSRR